MHWLLGSPSCQQTRMQWACSVPVVLSDFQPGTRPPSGVSVEFEIRSKFGLL